MKLLELSIALEIEDLVENNPFLAKASIEGLKRLTEEEFLNGIDEILEDVKCNESITTINKSKIKFLCEKIKIENSAKKRNKIFKQIEKIIN
ncbi:MAG: hypothetical protein PHN42_02075 [Bacilli bacterium]|nr:hypothetical protein [Bacilli bacterium]